MTVKPEIAIVYRTSNGKRYFTLKAAMKKEAILRLKSRNEMDGCYDDLVAGEHVQTTFYSNEQWERFQSIANRYYRRFRDAIRAVPITKEAK